MKKTQSQLIWVFICMFVLSNVAFSFGQGLIFTDINNHWSREFVEDIYYRKVTSGYSDATFKPANNISYLEVSVMLANLIGYNEELNGSVEEYEEVFNEYGIAVWGQGHLAHLLRNDIVLLEEVKEFYTDGKSNLAKRYSVASYIGRTLVKFSEKTINRSYYIPYKDEMAIPLIAKPYVDLLLNLEILNKDSNNGEFLPNNNITRGEVAKLISLAAKILDDVEVKEDDQSQKDDIELPLEETISIEGIFNNLYKGNRTIITLTKENGGLLVYDVAQTVEVKIDNKKAQLTQLKAGQRLEIKVVNEEVIEINGTSVRESFKGYFVRTWKGTDEVLTVKDMKQETKVFILSPNIKVYLDDKAELLANFKEGDIIKIFTKEDTIIEIQGISKIQNLRGVITNKGSESNLFIEVTSKEGDVVVVPLETNTNLRRDGKVVKLADVKVNDEVHVQYEYEKLKSVFASSVKRNVEGYIRNIVIGEKSYLTVETKDNIKEDFLIENFTNFKIGDIIADIYGMRVNYHVEIYIESNHVLRVQTSKKVEQHRLMGKVVSVTPLKNMIEIQIIENGKPKNIQLLTKKETILIGKLGGRVNLVDIKTGDEVLAVAEYINGAYVLERVVLIE